MSLVTKLSSVLEHRLSRRSFVARSAFVGSALSTGGVGFLLKPGTAYSALCFCGDPDCGCGTTCCVGYTEFCCVINGGYNSCPADTVMGGWWQADGSEYCDGPRYYMDCNGVCECSDGCGDGYSFCDPGCDGLDCGCAGGSCDNYLTGCFQFRYGQCNQDVGCIGMAMSRDAKGYGMVTAFGRAFFFGDDDYAGEVDRALAEPVTAIVTCAAGGYWFASAAGHVFPYGRARFHGDASTKHLVEPIVAMAPTPSGNGYWLTSSAGRVLAFGDAAYHGEPPAGQYPSPVVGIGATHTGKGYWLLTSAGRVLPYGDAVAHPQVDFDAYKAPFVAITVTPSGKGYWLVTSAGQVVRVGTAGNHGAALPQALPYPIVDMASTATGLGYYLVGSDGGLLIYGDAVSHGSTLASVSSGSVSSGSVSPDPSAGSNP
jgi:hypothetical protein